MRHGVIVVMVAMAANCGKVDAPQLAPDTAAPVDSGVGVTLDASTSSVSDVATDVVAVVDGNHLPRDTVADVAVLDSTTGTPDTSAVDSTEAEVSTDVVVALDVPVDPTEDASVVDAEDGMDVEPIADTLTEDADLSASDASDDASLALDAASADDAVDTTNAPADADVAESADAGELDASDLDAGAPIDVGAACDDGSQCTGDDVIQADGSCAGVPIPCLDAEPCTQDVCWPNVGCKHVWTPGCGGKPCGDCPEELGYSCVAGSETATCISADGSKVHIPSGVFMFGSKLRVLDDGELFFTPELWLFVRGFSIDRFQPSLKAVKDLLPAEGPCTPADVDGGCFYCDEMESGPVLVMGESSCACDVCSKLGGRLCSSIEWEKAAVGGCSRLGCSENDQACCSSATWPYAWGFEPPSCDVRVSCQCTFPAAPFCFDEGFLPWGVESGTLKEDRSPYGVFDMGGNGVEVIALTYFEFFGVLSTQCGLGEAPYESEVFDASCISTYEPSAIGLYMAGEPSRMSRERTYIWDIQPGNVYPNGPRCCYDLPTTVPQEPAP